MRHAPFFAALAFAALAPTAFAEPSSITGSKSAVWTNPIGGTSSGAGTDTLYFGEDNSLRWNGSTSFGTNAGDPFNLGLISLTNSSALNAPTQMTFSVTLDFATPIDEGAATFDFDAFLLAGEGEGGSELTFSIIPGQTASWASPGGATYTLEMLSLSDKEKWDGNVVSSFTTVENDNGTNPDHAFVYARLSIDEPQTAHVPEPGSLALGGIGLALLALRRMRRRLGSG